CINRKNRFPIRVNHIWLINESMLLRGIYNLVKPFLKQKMRDRVTLLDYQTNTKITFLGQNREPLWEVYDKKLIPDSIDGDLHFEPRQYLHRLMESESGLFTSF